MEESEWSQWLFSWEGAELCVGAFALQQKGATKQGDPYGLSKVHKAKNQSLIP